jgi:hypothetical protein
MKDELIKIQKHIRHGSFFDFLEPFSELEVIEEASDSVK